LYAQWVTGGRSNASKYEPKLVTPTTEIRTVPAGRKPNAAYRSREHLTEAEVVKLLEAARANRHGHRDALMVLVAYRHGLRVSELLDLQWNQVNFQHAALHVRRGKKGTPSTHPIRGDELRALHKLQHA
jgi:type 1 fimbriae regulatory protein FimB/type 1 fimbriae regulatory protein FimE